MRGSRCVIIIFAIFWPVWAQEVQEKAEEVTPVQTIEVIAKRQKLFGAELTPERVEQLHPADIGELLKMETPGVGAIRRAGAGLDPVLRGLGKDRVSLLMDGGHLYGGCPNRMDPPAFHISPYQIQSISVTKGPFDVTFGPVLSGVINIHMKRPPYYEKAEYHPQLKSGFDLVSRGLMGGLSIDGGEAPIALNLSYDYKDLDGYKDGKGNRITTELKQANYTLGFDYFLKKDRRVGINYSGQRTREMFYPTLAMDCPEDDLDAVAMELEFEQISAVISRLEGRIYCSWVDHLMDNFSKFDYVTPTPMMRMEALGESRTYGGKIKFTLKDNILLGIDYYNRWWDLTMRRWMLSGMPMPDIRAIPDATISDLGIFVQPERSFGKLTLIGGLRIDLVRARAEDVGPVEEGYYDTYYGAGTSEDLSKSETNLSCFIKGTYAVAEGIKIHLGVGRGVRTADQRERFRILQPIPGGRFDIGNPGLDPEVGTMYEIGSQGRIKGFFYTLEIFYHDLHDYIAQQMVGTFMGSPVMGYRNIKAYLYGCESSARYFVTDEISLLGSVSYTLGQDDDEDDPLAEIPPLEGRIGLRYDDPAGEVWGELMGRFVASQHRDNPVVDPGETPGFSTCDLRIGWRPSKKALLSLGIENLFDKYYYEHTSKNFAFAQDGYTQADRLPEPGRNISFNVTLRF